MKPIGDAASYLALIQQLDSADAVIESYCALLDRFGLKHFSMGELTSPRQPDTIFKRICVNRWPEPWHERWRKRQYVLNDPVTLTAARTSEPFYWRDVRPAQRCLGALIDAETLS